MKRREPKQTTTKRRKSVTTYQDIVDQTLKAQKKWLNRYYGHEIFKV